MLNEKMLIIIKRELNEKLMSKSFIIMTFIVPLIILAILGIQSLIMLYRGDKGSHVEVLTESAPLKARLQGRLSELDFIKDKTYIVGLETVLKEDIPDYIKSRKPDILSHKLDAVIFIPSSALEDKRIEYYSNTPSNTGIVEKLRGPINEVLIDQYFATKNLAQKDIFFARIGVNFSSYKVSEEEDFREEGFGKVITAFVLTFLLYISLASSGAMTMQSVLKEKNNKIVEVLLSSVSSRELMTGKIIGVTITMIAQMIIWLLPLPILLFTSWFPLPNNMMVDISYGSLIYFLINFLLAVLIYQGLFATIGSIFENPQEAQTAVMPVMMLLLIPFFISTSMMQNTDSPLAIISSFVPFATLIVMPGRFALVDLPIWHLVISTLINIGTILAIFPLAGKIYNVGILHAGKKPTWNEIIRWLKYK